MLHLIVGMVEEGCGFCLGCGGFFSLIKILTQTQYKPENFFSVLHSLRFTGYVFYYLYTYFMLLQ